MISAKSGTYEGEYADCAAGCSKVHKQGQFDLTPKPDLTVQSWASTPQTAHIEADSEFIYTSTKCHVGSCCETEIKVGQAFTLDSLLGESFPPSLCFRGFRILVEGMCHLASVDQKGKTLTVEKNQLRTDSINHKCN